MQQLEFVIHSAEEGGYWAEARSLPIFTQGDSLDELALMIDGAVKAYFPEVADRPLEIVWRFNEPTLAA